MTHLVPFSLRATPFCILIAFIAPGCAPAGNTHRGEQPLSAMTVVTEVVTPTPVPVSYEAVGSVQSRTISTIQSKITGLVTAVHVREGDRVEEGALLVEIDAREASTQQEMAQHAQAETHSALREVEESIQEAKSAKAMAQADYDVAEVTHRRLEALLKEEVGTQQGLDEAAARMKSAAARVAGAEATINALLARRSEMESKIGQANAGLASAEVSVSHTRLLAPARGAVTMKQVDVGDLAFPGVPLLRIESYENYWLEAMVDDAHAPGIQLGSTASVVLDALAPAPFEAEVDEIVPATDSASRTFTVKLALPSLDGLRPGMFGRAKFPTGTRAVLAVPGSAVVERGQLTSVFVVDAESKARLRLVKTGKAYGERVEILSGLNEGERIVVEHATPLRDGVPVQFS